MVNERGYGFTDIATVATNCWGKYDSKFNYGKNLASLT